MITGAELAGEQSERERIDLELLQCTLQGTCTIDRIVPGLRDARDRMIGEVHGDLPFREQLVEPTELDLHDLAELVLRERLEEDDLVDAVQELGAERALELAHRRGF